MMGISPTQYATLAHGRTGRTYRVGRNGPGSHAHGPDLATAGISVCTVPRGFGPGGLAETASRCSNATPCRPIARRGWVDQREHRRRLLAHHGARACEVLRVRAQLRA